MQNQIFSLSDKNKKVFGYNENQLIFSSKGHNTFETLIAATEKKGLLETIKTIDIADIQKLDYNEKAENFVIYYNKKGKTKKEGFSLSDNEYRGELVNSIASLKGFNKKVDEESKLMPLGLNLLGIVIIGIMIWAFRSVAIDAQNGIEYEASGRRSGIKELLAEGAIFLGPNGVLLLGIAGIAYVSYLAYNRFTKPAAVVTYE